MTHAYLYGISRYTGMDGPSGYGFEITFRLKKQPGETAPPAWPAELLQQLARYVFQTGTKISDTASSGCIGARSGSRDLYIQNKKICGI